MKGLGQNIKYYRKKCNLLQSELADKLQVSNKTISSWEIDRTEPNMEMVEKMCNVFNCTRSELVLGENSEKDFILEIAMSADRQKRIEKLPPEGKQELNQLIEYVLHKYSL